MILFAGILISSCAIKTDELIVQDEPTAYKVEIFKVDSVHVEQELTYSGTVEASKSIPLTFQANGTINNVLVEEGDFVVENQLLASLESDNYLSAYNVLKLSLSRLQMQWRG